VSAGGNAFRDPYGVSVAPNITPHGEVGLGAWSDAEIKRAITVGMSRDGRRLLPPMGYPYYAWMSAADLGALLGALAKSVAKFVGGRMKGR